MNIENLSIGQGVKFCIIGLVGGTVAAGTVYLIAYTAGKVFKQNSWYSAKAAVPLCMVSFGGGALVPMVSYLVLNDPGVLQAQRDLEDARLETRRVELIRRATTDLDTAAIEQQENQALLESMVGKASHNIDARDNQGRTALQYAQAKGRQDNVALLQRHGAGTENPEEIGRGLDPTELQLRAMRLDVPAIEQCGTLRIKLSKSLFFKAARDNRPDAVNALLNAGCHCNLHLMVQYPECLKVAVEHPSITNVDPLDKLGSTPLDRAILSGYEESVKILLQHGANPLKAGSSVHMVLPSGDTALHCAVRYAAPGILRELIEQTRNVDPVDAKGRTPLWHVIESGNGECAQCLLNRGADPLKADEDGVTPLHLASQKKNQALLQSMARKSSRDANARVDDSLNAAWASIREAARGTELYELDLAKLERWRQEGREFPESLLAYAMIMSNAEAVAYLVQAGMDPSAEITLSVDNVEVMRALLSGPQAIDTNRLNLLALEAVHRRKSDVVALLIEKGAHIDRSRISEAEWSLLSPEMQKLIEHR